MSKNAAKIQESIRFHMENGLDEIISDEAQNHFEEKIEIKTTPKAPIQVTQNRADAQIAKANDESRNHNSSSVNHFSSTSHALSALAKKSQNISKSSSSISINAIVDKAKKMAQSSQNLDELRKAVEEFDGCNLKKMATNTVFCDGCSDADVMLIGEAPGNHEDLQGIPFCGDSGKVLDAMFDAIDMSRKKDIYITNTVFWRPPGNRKPTEEELAICRPFVERHIQIMQPKVIVLIGATAIEAVLNKREPISKIRGKFMDFEPDFLEEKIKTFAIFHPSYLMRQSSKKRIAWQDMLSLKKFLQK